MIEIPIQIATSKREWVRTLFRDSNTLSHQVWGGGFRWSVWDVGGGERLRPLWTTYTRGTDGIVYVLDASCSSDEMEENRLELAKIMKVWQRGGGGGGGMICIEPSAGRVFGWVFMIRRRVFI